jgi:hypothetical protein
MVYPACKEEENDKIKSLKSSLNILSRSSPFFTLRFFIKIPPAGNRNRLPRKLPKNSHPVIPVKNTARHISQISSPFEN